MATLLTVSVDTAVLYAQYIAETIIAMAAFMEMNSVGCFEGLLEGTVILGSIKVNRHGGRPAGH